MDRARSKLGRSFCKGEDEGVLKGEEGGEGAHEEIGKDFIDFALSHQSANIHLKRKNERKKRSERKKEGKEVEKRRRVPRS